MSNYTQQMQKALFNRDFDAVKKIEVKFLNSLNEVQRKNRISALKIFNKGLYNLIKDII